MYTPVPMDLWAMVVKANALGTLMNNRRPFEEQLHEEGRTSPGH